MMNDKLKRLILFKEMHSFQVIAIVGCIMSVLAHGIMALLQKQIPSFSYIYPTWALIFIVGYLLNTQFKSDHHQH